MNMIFGSDFIFELNNLSPNARQRKRTQKISEHELVGRRNVLQHQGPGSDDMSLTGQIFPGKFGTAQSLERLDQMANAGLNHRLIDDQGKLYGKWMISDIADTQTHFDTQMRPRKIEFTINIRRSG